MRLCGIENICIRSIEMQAYVSMYLCQIYSHNHFGPVSFLLLLLSLSLIVLRTEQCRFEPQTGVQAALVSLIDLLWIFVKFELIFEICIHQLIKTDVFKRVRPIDL